MNTLSLISTFLKDRLDIAPERVTPEATLEELGVDSLMLMELLFEFEERTNVNLPKRLVTPKTIGALLAIVEQMQNPQAAN